MKPNNRHIFFFLVAILFGLFWSVPSVAQDENDPVASEYKNSNSGTSTDVTFSDDKSIEHEHLAKSKDSRDSVHVRSSNMGQRIKSSDAAKPSSAKEDDALSFNFLYYIIQKFKISDLVDE